MVKQSYLIIWALTLTLTLKEANQYSCMALWPMMKHHDTKFAYKRFSSSEDIVQIDIHWNFEPLLWPWPWSHGPINFFQKTIQLKIVCHQISFSCKRISSSEDRLESHSLTVWSLIVTLILKTAKQSFWKTLWLMMMQHRAKLGSKRFRDSDDIIWTNIYWQFEVKFCCEPDLEHSNPSSS